MAKHTDQYDWDEKGCSICGLSYSSHLADGSNPRTGYLCVVDGPSAPEIPIGKDCPYCGRLMSNREKASGACDDCAPRESDA